MLSQAWIVLASQYVEGNAAQQANDAARAAADTALALAPDLAAAHLARGTLLQTADFDWHGAETEYRRAAELEPDDSLAKQRQGYMLATLGQMEPAIDLTRQALATDPLNALWHVWLGLYLIPLDRLDEAEAAIRMAIELQPGAAGFYYQLTIVQIQRGNAAAALATARQELPSIFQDIALAWALQIGEDHAAADAALRVLTDKYAGSAAYQIAEVYALRGDGDRAFEWLDRAWTNRDSGIVYLLYDPFLLRYKSDPRFAAFCRKARLPAPGEHVAM
jgi:tetratricopeptide (TPR) repeat protein